VREALIRYTEWARAFSAQSRNGAYNWAAPKIPSTVWADVAAFATVFNWFAPATFPRHQHLRRRTGRTGDGDDRRHHCGRYLNYMPERHRQ